MAFDRGGPDPSTAEIDQYIGIYARSNGGLYGGGGR